jgi:hypothetical protein
MTPAEIVAVIIVTVDDTTTLLCVIQALTVVMIKVNDVVVFVLMLVNPF